MAFLWLTMRITEEQDRRARENRVRERLPQAFQELCASLEECLEAFRQAFGPHAAEGNFKPDLAVITVRDAQNGHWTARSTIEIAPLPEVPGFRIHRGGDPLVIEVGLLPDEKIFYRDRDEFISLEELTRRILDRALFPDLGE